MTPKTISRLAVAALVISAIALVTVAFRIEITLTNDTWVGIIASFVGAAATLIVGTQIYGLISTKKDIKEIRSLQNELREQQKKLQEELACSETKFQGNHFFAQGLAFIKTQPFSAFISFLKAAAEHLRCKSFENCKIALGNCEREIRHIQSTKATVNTYEIDKPIDEIVESMRKTPEYNLIKDQVENLLKNYQKAIQEVKEAQTKQPAKSE